MPLGEALTMVERLVDRGEAVWIYNNGRRAFRVRKLEIDRSRQVATILVNYADVDISDPVFSHLETGELRSEPKLQGEGVALSAHMVVSLIPDARMNSKYLMLLEDVPGVGRSKITPFLTSLFRHGTYFRFDTETGEKKACRPIPEIVGYESETLKESLRTGTIKGFELVKHNPPSEFDDGDYLVEKSRSIKLDVKLDPDRDTLIEVTNRLLKKVRLRGFNDLRVRFYSDIGKPGTITMGTARENAEDALLVKNFRISSEKALPQCSGEILAELKAPMLKALLETRRQ